MLCHVSQRLIIRDDLHPPVDETLNIPVVRIRPYQIRILAHLNHQKNERYQNRKAREYLGEIGPLLESFTIQYCFRSPRYGFDRCPLWDNTGQSSSIRASGHSRPKAAALVITNHCHHSENADLRSLEKNLRILP